MLDRAIAKSFFTNTADCASVVCSGGNMLVHLKIYKNAFKYRIFKSKLQENWIQQIDR